MKETKENILQTAYDLFLANNYEAVTINSIIEATGLTKGGIYHYFASKEEIFKAVVDRYMSENSMEIPLEHPTLKELIDFQINQVKVQMIRSIDSKNEMSRVLPLQHFSLMITAMKYYPGYVEIKNNFFNSNITKWKKVLFEAIKKGEIRSDIDIEVTAFNFLLTGAGIAANIIFSGSADYALIMYERQLNELYKLLKM